MDLKATHETGSPTSGSVSSYLVPAFFDRAGFDGIPTAGYKKCSESLSRRSDCPLPRQVFADLLRTFLETVAPMSERLGAGRRSFKLAFSEPAGERQAAQGEFSNTF